MRIEKGTSLKEDLQWFYFHFPMSSSHFYKASSWWWSKWCTPILCVCICITITLKDMETLCMNGPFLTNDYKINCIQQKVLQNNVCRKTKRKRKEAYKEIRTNVAFLLQAMYLRCGRRIKVVSLQHHSIPIWSPSKSQWNRAQPVFPTVSIQIYLSHKVICLEFFG